MNCCMLLGRWITTTASECDTSLSTSVRIHPKSRFLCQEREKEREAKREKKRLEKEKKRKLEEACRSKMRRRWE